MTPSLMLPTFSAPQSRSPCATSDNGKENLMTTEIDNNVVFAYTLQQTIEDGVL
jgi:hypothetical protein